MKTLIALLVGCLSFVLFCSFAIAAEEKPLKAGDLAPSFNTFDFKGKPLSLDDAIKQGPLVLVFLRGFG